MKRFLKLYCIFASRTLKTFMEYKADFLIGVLSFVIIQSVEILMISIIFSQIPSLLGWTFNQIIFIYGFSLLPKGLDHLLSDNLWDVAFFTIQRGEFDKYLTRPLNPLLHVIMERFQFDAFGELILGIVFISAVAPSLGIKLSFIRVLLIIIAVPFGTLIYTSLKILCTALAFWVKRSGNLLSMVYDVNDFAKYPVTIYNNFVKNIITYIIPFAFTAYYPALYFLKGVNPIFNIGGTVFFGIVLFAVSYSVWCRGISSYESAGS